MNCFRAIRALEMEGDWIPEAKCRVLMAVANARPRTKWLVDKGLSSRALDDTIPNNRRTTISPVCMEWKNGRWIPIQTPSRLRSLGTILAPRDLFKDGMKKRLEIVDGDLLP